MWPPAAQRCANPEASREARIRSERYLATGLVCLIHLSFPRLILTAGAQQTEDHIDHGANVGRARSTASPGSKQKRGKQCLGCRTESRLLLMLWENRSEERR